MEDLELAIEIVRTYDSVKGVSKGWRKASDRMMEEAQKYFSSQQDDTARLLRNLSLLFLEVSENIDKDCDIKFKKYEEAKERLYRDIVE